MTDTLKDRIASLKDRNLMGLCENSCAYESMLGGAMQIISELEAKHETLKAAAERRIAAEIGCSQYRMNTGGGGSGGYATSQQELDAAREEFDKAMEE